MNTNSSSEVAKIIGIHPNTVRLYEEWGLIPQAERKANGYRVFTDFHIEQLRLARIAFQIEIRQSCSTFRFTRLPFLVVTFRLDIEAILLFP